MPPLCDREAAACSFQIAESKYKAGLEGNISVPGEKDLLIEEPLTSADEDVDMGSLI